MARDQCRTIEGTSAGPGDTTHFMLECYCLNRFDAKASKRAVPGSRRTRPAWATVDARCAEQLSVDAPISQNNFARIVDR